MGLNKKLIRFNKYSHFKERLDAKDISPQSVVFIVETGQIWTQGEFFGGHWDHITGRPTTFTPSAHKHGSITNDGKIGTSANRIIETTTGGSLTPVAKNTAYNKDFGTGKNQVAMGNHTHPNFTRTVAGLVPAPGADTTTRYLREDGKWVIPPDTHWTTGIRAGASGTNANSVANDPFIKVLDNTTYRSQVQILGGTNITAKSDATGKITIDGAHNHTLKLIAGASTATVNSTADVANPYIRLFSDNAHQGNIRIVGGTNVDAVSKSGVITLTATDTKYTAGSNITINGSNVIAGNYPSLTKANLDTGTLTTQSVATPQVLASWLSGKNYATVGYVDELEIGGRNLLLNSKSITLLGSDNPAGANRSNFVNSEGFTEVTVTSTGAAGSTHHYRTEFQNLFTDGFFRSSEDYVLSFDYKTNSGNARIAIDTRPGGAGYFTFHPENTNGEWRRGYLVLNWIITTQTSSLFLVAPDKRSDGVEGHYVAYRKLKLEKGNKPTDWTPAPEDQVSDWNTTDVNSFSYIKNKPSTFTPSAHKHNASDINAGVLGIARIPTGTTSSTVALGNHTHTFASLTSKPTTLGGYGITDAMYENNARSSTDLNLQKTQGFYAVNSTPANSPSGTGGYGNLLVVRSSSDRFAQMYFGTSVNELFYRNGTGGTPTWGNWVKVYHSGNLTKLSQLSNDLFSSPTFSGDTTITGDIILPKSNGNITWNSATWQQRIATTDTTSTTGDVFTFQESSNSGSSWKNLMTIKANGTVEATTFIGNVTGNITGSAGSTANWAGNTYTNSNITNEVYLMTSTNGTYWRRTLANRYVDTSSNQSIAGIKNFTGQLGLPGIVTNYIKSGTGDGGTTTTYNTYLHLHYGLGIGDHQDNVRIAINARTGSITANSFIGKATSAGTADTAADATKWAAQGYSATQLTTTPTYLMGYDGSNWRPLSNNIYEPTVSSYSFTKSLQLSTTWQDTGIGYNNIPTGTYAFSVYSNNYSVGGGNYSSTFSGVINWYSSGTNYSGTDEILMQGSGHASPRHIYIRVIHSPGASGTHLRLQIATDVNTSAVSSYIFKFKQII